MAAPLSEEAETLLESEEEDVPLVAAAAVPLASATSSVVLGDAGGECRGVILGDSPGKKRECKILV